MVQAVSVAVRNSAGAAFEFPGAKAASIPTGGYTFTSGTRTFDPGSYDASVAVQINNTWYNLSAHKIIVSAAAPANTMVFDQEFNGYAGQGGPTLESKALDGSPIRAGRTSAAATRTRACSTGTTTRCRTATTS